MRIGETAVIYEARNLSAPAQPAMALVTLRTTFSEDRLAQPTLPDRARPARRARTR